MRQNNNFLDIKFINRVSVITIMTYLIGVYILKLIYRCKFCDVIIFNPEILDELSLISVVISTLVFLSGFLLLFLIPGWIITLCFRNVKEDILISVGLSFIISIASLAALTTLFKIIWRHNLDRIILLGIIVFIVSLGLIFLRCKSQQGFKRGIYIKFHSSRLIPYVLLVLITISLVAIFHERIIDRGLVRYDYREETILSIPLGKQPDDLEIFGLADSLKRHLLPYWDLEYADRFGFVFTDPPFYALISMFSILFFGESKVSLSLTSIGFITALFLIIFGHSKKKKLIRFLICSAFLLAYLYFFLRDVTAFIFVEHFFIFLVITSYCYLLRRSYSMFLAFGTVATLTRFYGIFFTLVGFAGFAIFFRERRPELRPVLLRYSCIVMGLAAFIVAVGVLTGNLSVYWKTIIVEHLLRFDYFNFLSRKFPEAVVDNLTFSFRGSLQLLLWCFYSTAFTFPILFLFGKDRKENFYSFVGLIYFTLVFISRYQFMRYVIPLIPLTAIVVSNKLERWISK